MWSHKNHNGPPIKVDPIPECVVLLLLYDKGRLKASHAPGRPSSLLLGSLRLGYSVNYKNDVHILCFKFLGIHVYFDEYEI